MNFFVVIWDIADTRLHGPYETREAALDWITENREDNVEYGLTQLPVERITE